MGESKYRRSVQASSPSQRLSISALTSSPPPPIAPDRPSSDRPDATRISHLLHSTALTAGHTCFLRMNSTTVQNIRSAPASDFIVLFTPAIPAGPASSSSPYVRPPGSQDFGYPPPQAYAHGRRITGLPMDPFEPLGRALALRHKRVRHVPFVPGSPGAGVGTIHSTFLESARGVVVVLCESSGSDIFGSAPLTDTPSPYSGHIPVHNPAESQADFINTIWQHGYWNTNPDETPLVLVVVSEGRDRAEMLVKSCGLQQFDTIVYAENYEPGTLDGIARTLFGS